MEKPIAKTDEPSASAQPQRVVSSDPFQSWAEQYAKSEPGAKAALRAEGMTLARARRAAFAQLIQKDPKQAVETALPYHLRKALPPEITSQIEYPVSGRGEYRVDGVLPPAGVATVEEPITREVVLGDQKFSAYTYGKKLGVMSRESAAILGVGITQPDGKRRLALREENYAVLEPEEARDRFIKSTPKKAICPVSNAVIEPTNSDIAVDTGDQLIWLCKGGHMEMWLETPDGQRVLAGDMYDSGDADSPPPAKADGIVVSPAWTHGPKRFLILNLAFSNQYPSYPPHSSAALETSAQQVMAAFTKSSYGKMQPSYAVTPLLTLPNTDEFYVDNDVQMLADARVVAANYVDGLGQHPYDTADFDFDCAIFKSSFGRSYGGRGGIGAKRAWSVSTNAYVLAHEWGHNFGIWHASKWIATTGSPIGDGTIEDYGDIWDVMGTSYSANLVYNSFSRRRLGWLTEPELPLITNSGTYRIYDSEAPSLTGGRLYGFRAAGNAHIYHVEFRPREVDRDQFMDNGVLLRWTGEWQAQLLEMSLLTKQYSNVLLMGRTFSDFQPGLHITPLGTGLDGTEQYIDVAVSFDTIATNSAPVGILSGNLEVNPSESQQLTATAIDPDGDTLSYWWNFGDGTCSTNGLATQTKQWNYSGTFQVACFISDRRGGSTVRTISVRVGTPATGRSSVSGRVTNEQGLPLEGMVVSSYYNSFYTFTDSDGYYFIGGIHEGDGTALAKGATEKTFFTPPAAMGINFTVPWTLPSQSHSNLVSVDAVAASVKEGETASYTLTRSGSTAAALDVYFNLLGTASAGQDYIFSASKSTIPAGSASVVIPVPVSLDLPLDPGETLVVSLKPGVAYGLGGRPRASVLIHDAAIKNGSGLLHEWWTGLTGSTVSDLLMSPAYPDAPTGRELWAKSFQMETATTNIAHRFRGTFTSQVSGVHYFNISSDDSSELWFGNDHTPKGRRKIAFVNGTTAFQEWGKFPEQRSAAISIPAGQPFYIEVLCKQGSGTQHLSVGVEYPNGSMERPISIQRLNLPASETIPGGAWTGSDIGNTPGFGAHGIGQQPLTVAPTLRYRFVGPANSAVTDGTSLPEMGGGPPAVLRGAGATWAASGSGLDLPGGSSATQAYIDLPNNVLTNNRFYHSASYEVWYVQQSHQSNSHVFDFGALYDEITGENLEITAPGGMFSPLYSPVVSLSGNVGLTAGQRFQRFQYYPAPIDRTTEGTTVLNQLTHMVILYNKTDRNWRWYRNGVLIDMIPDPSGVYAIMDINNWLGRSATSTDANADALYREFRVYDYALTDAQVRGSFHAGPDKVNLPDPFQFSQRATNYPFWISGSGSLADGALSDSFQLVSQQLSGDGEVRAKIGSLQEAGTNSVLGVMLRGNTATNAPFGFLGWAGDGSIRWMTRKTSGAQVVQSTHTFPVRPQWLKVCRSGNVLTAYVAADLTHWDQIGESVLVNGLPIQTLAGSAIADGIAARVNEVLSPTLVFDMGTSWKYIRPVGNAAPVGWTTIGFVDTSWSSGNGFIGFEGGNPNLPLSPGIQTTTSAPTASQNVTYFRKSFQYTAGNPANARVAIDHAIDDGVTYYLNGKLLGSVRHTPGNALASSAIGYSGDVNGVELEAVVVASDSGLLDGTNVLSAELHQISAPNSDMVFGARLQITPGSAGIAALGRIDELVVSPGFTNGKGVAVESYDSLAAGTLASLTSNAAYPDSPTQRAIQNGLFEVTPRNTSHYGQRMRGVFTAPATGNHTFYIAGGTEAQMYLGTTSSSTSRQLIASITAPTANRAWGSNAPQHSAPIPLIAGTRYYLDVVRAGSSVTPRDISVGVALPDGTPEFPMLAGRLEPYLPQGPFNLWSDSRFGANAGNPAIAGEDADPDGDGLSNWAEYGFLRNPLQADPGSVLVPKPQGGQLVVTYQRPAGQTDILYLPEWSDNLVDWYDTSITQTVISNDGDVETVEVQTPATAGGKRFVRITLE